MLWNKDARKHVNKRSPLKESMSPSPHHEENDDASTGSFPVVRRKPRRAAKTKFKRINF